MGTVLFPISFLVIGVAAVNVLVIHDPEPIGASAFLYMLCIAGGLISAFAHSASSRQLRRHPSKLALAITGALSAGVFFAALGSFYLGLHIASAIFFAFTLSISVAVATPLFSKRRAQ